jgi:hypothetical protein
MSSNTENGGNWLNKLNLTNEQKNKYRKEWKGARSQNARNNVERNAKATAKRRGKNLINSVARLNIRESKREVQAVSKIADKGAGIVAGLIKKGYGNDAMVVLVFGLVSLVGSDRLVGNAIRTMPSMRPRTSARGPVNYAFKRALFELQRYYSDVQSPYLYWREELFATYGPERASFFGKVMDVAVIVLTFMYLAVRIGRFSPEFIDVVGPSLSQLYKRMQDKKMAAVAVSAVLTFYLQVVQDQVLLNRKTMGGLMALLTKEIMKRRTPTQTQVNNAIQTIAAALQGAQVRGPVQPQQVINYVQNPRVVSPGGTNLTMSPNGGGARRAATLANLAQNVAAATAFSTPPRTPERIRAVGPNGRSYVMNKNQWNRLPNTGNDSTTPLRRGIQIKYAKTSNLPSRSRP